MYQENKLANPTDAYLGIRNLTANAFALKVRLLVELFSIMNLQKKKTNNEPNFTVYNFFSRLWSF